MRWCGHAAEFSERSGAACISDDVMALSKIPRLSLLLDNSYLKRRIRNRKKREYSVHPINKQREMFGEFHHLYGELRFLERFFEYTRMSVQTFDFVLNKIKDR